MTISGNVSSTEYEGRRANLMATLVNLIIGLLATDDAIWPCGLILGYGLTGYVPYAEDTVQIGTGDAAETDFTYDTGGGIEPESASLVAGGVTLTDDGCGNLAGSGGSGSINYETGKVVVAFDAAPAGAAAVNLTYKSDPCAVLDIETDTANSDSGMVVRFGAVRLSELKVGVVSQTAPTAAVLKRLAINNVYAA